MPRPCLNDISDTRQSKRRRLNDSSDNDDLPEPLAASGLLLEKDEHVNLVARDEDKAQVDCEQREIDVDSAAGNITHDDWSECCYGMLPAITVRLRHRSGISNPQLHSRIGVTFRAPNTTLFSQDDKIIEFEIQDTIYSSILKELSSLEDITMQMYCRSSLDLPDHSSSHTTRRRVRKVSQIWNLDVIIYGVIALEDFIGKYLSKNRIYLQDPVDCERAVLYRNPHMISKGSGVVLTDSFKSSPSTVEIERLSVGPDLLSQLMVEQTPLPEMEPPPAVTTTLFRHQKQALKFMVRREQGWDFESGRDIWTTENGQHGCQNYRNTVNGRSQSDPPPSFHGGLLADDMGLGKTLSMIALIAANQRLNSPPRRVSSCTGEMYPKLKSTLLIVPPSLIQAWEKQFRMHIRQGTFHLHIYHGQNRKGIEYLQQCDIVITTFQTLSSAWMKQNIHNIQDPLFAVLWHRVILDEAHTIQNAQSQLARACCALQAERRWAVTGTPIQNKLTDFASIVKFLRVYPYCDQKIFDEEISRPWHLADPEGFLRLKSLVRTITISRTKTVIDLPARVDEIHHLEFSPEERNGYNAVNRDTIALFEEAISSGRQSRKTFNALTRLNFLRLFCNLGLLANIRPSPVNHLAFRESVTPSTQSIEFDDFYSKILDESNTCAQCGQPLLEDLLEGVSTPDFEDLPSIACANSICHNYKSDPDYSQPDLILFSQNEDVNASTAPSVPLIPSDQTLLPFEPVPTKIKALVTNLSQNCRTEKSVVFSFWTSTLDIVQRMLIENGITCTRIDGKMSLARRSESMRCFQTDDSFRVILVSITCGGAGLDLTAGSRAYLLEPHWNPMIEEQALCRVHRVGQKRSVTTIRYLMRGSFEEQVVEIQKRKKKLAEVTFGSKQISEQGIGLGTLVYLKSVLE